MAIQAKSVLQLESNLQLKQYSRVETNSVHFELKN